MESREANEILHSSMSIARQWKHKKINFYIQITRAFNEFLYVILNDS